jgi:transcription antitermination factor NusG
MHSVSESWTLLRLNPLNQSRYVDHVTESFPEIPTYFPQYLKTTRPARKRKPILVTKPVYPGYIFARINLQDHTIHQLTSTPVRAYFVRFGGTIGMIPDRVIIELKKLESLNMLVRELPRRDPFAPGTRVVIHLPMSDIRGIVTMLLHANRAIVDTSLCKVTVPIHTLVALG